MSLKALIFVCCFILFTSCAWSQTVDSLMTRQKVLALACADTVAINKTQVSGLAAFEERDSREVPGSLVIITEEEISAMNAKDLMDVIQLTTSLSLGRDVEDGIGIGIRGNWAQEGKILVMINGVPVNDLDYGTYNLGGRVSLSMVSRIEITNGPGSVKYGGTAALGVINVVLKSNSEFSGSLVEGDLNYSRGINTRKSFGFSGNYTIANKYKLSIGFNTVKSLRSTAFQLLPEGDTLSWADSSQVESTYFNIGLQRNRFRSNIYFSNYQYNISDALNSVLMRQLGADLIWADKLAAHTRIKYQFLFQDQLPWFDINTLDSSYINSNTRAQKSQFNVALNTQFNDHFFLDYGIQLFQQRSSIVMRNQKFALNGENQINIQDAAFYAEGTYRGNLGVLIVGARMETHTLSKWSFAPRIAFSKIWKRAYIKSMFSEAFKIPTLQNFNNADLEVGLKNEIVRMFECSLGANFDKKLQSEISLYHTQIDRPIVYTVVGLEENYSNQLRAGTQGVDGWLQWQIKKAKLKLSGTYYQVIKRSDFPQMEVYGNSPSYWGMPNLRLGVTYSQSLAGNWKLFSALFWQSPFYSDFPSHTAVHGGPIFNFAVHKRSEKIKALNFNVGLNNILNSTFWIGSPYSNAIPNMPTFQRQLCITIQYKLD